MNSVEFGKKCRPYNIQYKDIFGYVPCRNDYNCSQDEYFNALLKAIETKCELSTIIPQKTKIFKILIKNIEIKKVNKLTELIDEMYKKK